MATLRKQRKTSFIDYRVNGIRFRKAVGTSKKLAELALKNFEVKLAKKMNWGLKAKTVHSRNFSQI